MKILKLTLIIIVFLISLGKPLTAQSWKNTMQVADSLARTGQSSAAFGLILQQEADTIQLSDEERLKWRRSTAAFYHQYDESPERIIQEYNKVLWLARKIYQEAPQMWFKDFIDLAFAWYSTSPAEPARQWMSEQIPLVESIYGKNSISTARFYSIYSLTLRKLTDYDLANVYIDQAIQIAQQNNDDNSLSDFYLNKGLNLYHQGQQEASYEFRLKAIEILERQPDKNATRLARTYCNLGEVMERARQPEKAITWLDKAIEVYDKIFEPTDGNYYYLWLAYARATLQLQQYEKSASCYRKAIAVTPESPAPYEGLARIALARGKYAEAHQMIDTSLALFPYRQGMALEGFDRAAALPFYLNTRTRIFQEQYKQNQNLDFLNFAAENAAETQRVALYNINKSRSEYNKTLPYQEAIGFNKRYLDITYERFRHTNQPYFLEAAFDIAEMNKALLLYQSLKINKGLEACPLPDQLEAQEWSMRSNITALEKSIYEKGGSNEKTDALFQLKNEYEKVKKAIETQCAEYFRTAEIFPSSNMQMAMNMLYPGATMLHYTLTDSALYTFIVQYNGVKLLREQNIQQLPELVKAFTQLAKEVRPGASYRTRAIDFVRVGTALYDILVRPFEDELQEHVVIIPDGYLNLLPFDLLLRNADRVPHAFHLHEYWLKTHEISYCYSANLLKEMSAPILTPAPEPLLALAPFYDPSVVADATSQRTNEAASRDAFGPLPFSGEEAFSIARIMGGQALTGQAAADSTLAGQLDRFRCLHFATHARANAEQGVFSFLAFGPDKPQYWYAKDIYNLRLKADLVALSACESGLGELRDGEGLISLARAFAYSGARTVLTTLWEVNDESAKDTSCRFYENLRKGLTKSQSLTQAKRHWLNTHKGSLAHPFYWGGFSLIGHPGAMN